MDLVVEVFNRATKIVEHSDFSKCYLIFAIHKKEAGVIKGETHTFYRVVRGLIRHTYIGYPYYAINSTIKRQARKTQSDYDSLFRQYKSETLTHTCSQQEHILELLKKHKRNALTCFEANICKCHRKHLAEAVTMLPGFDSELKRI